MQQKRHLSLLNSIGSLFHGIAALIGAGRICASNSTCLTGWQSVCYAPVCASGGSTLVDPQTPRCLHFEYLLNPVVVYMAAGCQKYLVRHLAPVQGLSVGANQNFGCVIKLLNILQKGTVTKRVTRTVE